MNERMIKRKISQKNEIVTMGQILQSFMKKHNVEIPKIYLDSLERVRVFKNHMGCMICLSHSTTSTGYPRMRDPLTHRMIPIRRIIMEALKGSISRNEIVRSTRKCSTTGCLNPYHFYVKKINRKKK